MSAPPVTYNVDCPAVCWLQERTAAAVTALGLSELLA